MNRYEIYLEGCSNPVYTYKTLTWLIRRLDLLASLHTIKQCKVRYIWTNRVYFITFNGGKWNS